MGALMPRPLYRRQTHKPDGRLLNSGPLGYGYGGGGGRVGVGVGVPVIATAGELNT
jgi:hypothetical protein